ncbi:putative lipid II flippase FtsW, partial [Mycolicibacterium elephantis]
LFIIGIMANAARHEPEAVAALRAGRDDRMNRLLRLPLPAPYVPSRTEALRDRLHKQKTNQKQRSRAAKPARPAAKSARKPAAENRRKAHAAARPVRASRHHGGGRTEKGRRSRTLEGQRYG